MTGKLVCPFCDRQEPPSARPGRCPRCRVPLRYVVEPSSRLEEPSGRGVWRYRALLPEVEPVTLGEGGTPLVPSLRLGRKLGVELSFKLEGANPTGSFKDRGASVLVSVLVQLGVEKVADDSSGNAGAALAAYAARAGIPAVLYVPAHASGKKLAQIRAYGAELVEVPGPRPNATAAVRRACGEDSSLAYASHNESPYFEAGLRTLAYELAEELAWEVPEHLVVPVGGGALFLGLVQGFSDLVRIGLIRKAPKVHAVQAAACAPIARAWELGLAAPEPVQLEETVAEGVCIAAPPRGREILAALRETGGSAVAVGEEKILAAWLDLAQQEGIYIEPTSAVALAGLYPLVENGAIAPGEAVVIPLTGTGLKSPG